MTTFSKNIKAKYQKFNYEDICKDYEWISSIAKKNFSEINELTFSINFKIDDMGYRCNSIEEFKNHAYGHQIIVSDYIICIYSKNTKSYEPTIMVIFVDTTEKQISISSEVKDDFIQFCSALEKDLAEAVSQQSTEKNIVTNNLQVENMTIIGDNNTIKDSNIGNKTITSKDDKESFWKPVFQSIASKAIWISLVAWLLLILGFKIPWEALFN